jgi:hypothetical protein
MIKNNRIPNTRCNYTECTNVKNIKCNWCNEWRHNEHNWNYKNQTQTTRIKMDTNIEKCGVCLIINRCNLNHRFDQVNSINSSLDCLGKININNLSVNQLIYLLPLQFTKMSSSIEIIQSREGCNLNATPRTRTQTLQTSLINQRHNKKTWQNCGLFCK